MVTAIHSMEESMMKAKNNGSFNLTSRDQPAVINMSFLSIQSTLSKTDTFGTGTSCLSWRGVRLIESQIKGVKKGRDRLTEVSVKRESTVLSNFIKRLV